MTSPVDLHSHSTASDGALSPADVVALAAERGVRHFALTDHDTTAGIAEATAAAHALGVELIPAIEISAWTGREIHILGYFIDPDHPRLRALTAQRGDERLARAAAMCERLAELGFPVELERVLARATGQVGRPHIAAELVAAGHCRDFSNAFDRLIGNDGPAYVESPRVTGPQAIAAIHAAGGVAALAHPGVGDPDLSGALPTLAQAGLDAVEVAHPAHDRSARRNWRRLARAHGLLCTGGSDFHRPGGLYPGDHGVEVDVLEALRAQTRDSTPG
jgi:predicted metal-dependent phosphoesterase TrpH